MTGRLARPRPDLPDKPEWYKQPLEPVDKPPVAADRQQLPVDIQLEAVDTRRQAAVDRRLWAVADTSRTEAQLAAAGPEAAHAAREVAAPEAVGPGPALAPAAMHSAAIRLSTGHSMPTPVMPHRA